MNDAYQAIYDAVRSRISNGDIGRAVEEVARNAFDMGNLRAQMSEQLYSVASQMERPSVLYRPALSIDGNQWCALYGANLQDGVAGFGDTVADAMRSFDEAWNNWNALVRHEERKADKTAHSQFGVGS